MPPVILSHASLQCNCPQCNKQIGETVAWLKTRHVIFAGILVLAAMFLGSCDGPFPTVGTLTADVNQGNVTALVDPGETTVIRIIAEFGVRPGFDNALALFWTSSNISNSVPGAANNSVGLPATTPFNAKFMIGQDFPLLDGQVVDVQFKVFYRRPASNTEFTFWSKRVSFVAGGQLGATNLCVLRYRRSTGPLEDKPNMPQEQAAAHPFQVPKPNSPPGQYIPGEFPFQSGWEHAGELRQSFGECMTEHPCFGAHARELRNVGRNRIHVTLNQLTGQRLVHLEPGDVATVREDIASISCERVVNQQAVLDAVCRALPDEPACNH